MAITLTTAMCNSFKKELLFGAHDLRAGEDALKIGLFVAQAGGSGTYGAATTNYTTDIAGSDELPTASGYTITGIALTNINPTLDGSTAVADFDTAEWGSSSLTSFGAFIYNTTPAASVTANATVCILAFGADKSSSSGTFQIVFPNADASNAIIRVA
jgi:hypothetical protein